MRKMRQIGEVSLSALEDQWQRDATSAAIAGARGVVQMGGPIPPGTPIGRLSETEWGWIVAAILFGWISTRARQAVSEHLDTERTIRMTALDPNAWDAGAVEAVLPDLADACADLGWSKPLAEWSRENIVEFLLKAMPLIRKAMLARDLSERGVTRKLARRMSNGRFAADAGGEMPDRVVVQHLAAT
jgi:hypothetical protein